MSGKGSAPRPLSVTQSQFDQAFDMIFRKREQCGLCQKPKDSCGCCPTDDGPGQENEAVGFKQLEKTASHEALNEQAKAAHVRWRYERRRFERN